MLIAFLTYAKVSALIYPLSYDWKAKLVKQSFIATDAQAILSIPLSACLLEDKLVWAYTPKGKFTVCSAYKLAIYDFAEGCMEGTSNEESHKSFWRRIWSLHLPIKMKSFARKVCCNIIPTKANLYHQKVIEESLCEACGLEEETIDNAFWDCEHARVV